MFKMRFLFIFLTCFSLPSVAETVFLKAIVNGEPITSYEVVARKKLASELLKKDNIKFTDEQIEEKVLSELINDKIKVAEAKRYDINISSEDINNALSRMEQFLKLKPGEYKQLAKKLDIEESIVDNQIRADVLWMKFVYSVLRSYINITDSEVQDFIVNSNKKDNFQYDLISFIVAKQDLSKTISLLNTVSNCDDFQKLAQTKGKNGSGIKLTFKDNEMDPVLYKEISSSKINSFIQSPIKQKDTETFFYICNKQNYIYEPSEDEYEHIKYGLLQSKLEAYTNKYFEKIKANAVIEIKD